MPNYPVNTPVPQLKDKVITVTGAASGIGLATAHILACSGANLAIADVQPLDSVVEDLQKHYGVKVVGSKVDVRRGEDVSNWIKSTVEHFGKIDGSANIAGVLSLKGQPPFAPIKDYASEQFEFIMSVNSTGMFNCLKAELSNMKEGAAIVNVSSVAGLGATPGICGYGASKAAVISLTKTAAREEGKRAIRVNAVCPGVIDTPMVDLAEQQMDQDSVTRLQALNRKADPTEVGHLLAWLLSDQASFVTGAVYTVDGGYTA